MSQCVEVIAKSDCSHNPSIKRPYHSVIKNKQIRQIIQNTYNWQIANLDF